MGFNFQFHTDVKEQESLLWEKAEKRLTELGLRHSFITGASVIIKEEVPTNTPKAIKATVTVQMSPENQTAVKKGGAAMETLKESLDAVERQVKTAIELKQKPWETPNDPSKKLKKEFEE